MTLLTRYIVRAVVSGALLVLLALMALDGLLSFFREIGDTGEGNYDVARALLYVVLTLPERVYDLFPAAVAIGGVLALGGLAANSELVVMRAAGVSIGRILGQVMQGGVILIIAVVALGEGVAPVSQNYGERMRTSAIAGEAVADTARGLWMRDGERFVNVGRVMPGHELRAVAVYEFSEGELVSALQAERARYATDYWLLENVAATNFAGELLQTERREKLRQERLIPPDMLQVLAVSPETLPSWQLYDYVRYLQRNQLDSARHELALWKKLVTPLSTLVMLLLSLPVIFGSLRATGAGQRVFIGSLIGIGYYLVSELFAHVAIVYGLAVPAAALAPVILFAIVGVLALRRIM